MARTLAGAGLEAVFSYAGVTRAPRTQPLPTRVGGFGGVEGLRRYLTSEGMTHVIDATHPFAAQISANAAVACTALGLPHCTLERPKWAQRPGEFWTTVPDIASAVEALPQAPARVFLAIGRQNLADFAVRPQHRYLLRLVDPPEGDLPLPNTDVVVARGPFTAEADTALMLARDTQIVVAKNSGGQGARAKLDAARALHLPVIMIDRPARSRRPVMHDVDEVMGWLAHSARLGV